MPFAARPFARKLWKDWVKPLAVILVVFGTFRSAIADWNDVPTGSMKPTILEGDRILVNKLAYGLRVPFTTRWIAAWGGPDSGEIAVLFSPADGKRLVKRIIGLPGDTVELRGNALIVNGQAAAYAALEQAVIDRLAASERPSHAYARERIGAASHAVMSTPAVGARRDFGPITIPAGRYLVMGDNRDQSADSRVFGLVPRRLIVGRSSAVAFSLDREHYLRPRWSRFLKALD
ncbi:MAG: signal peptidase I [Phycisphaerales bacterium]